MQNSARNAGWPYLRQKDAIRCIVGTAGNTSVINATVSSLDMSILSELPFSSSWIMLFAIHWIDLPKNNHVFYCRGPCELFSQEEIDRWEMQMNQRVQRQVVAQVHAQIHAQHGQAHLCPTCGQPSPKASS